MGYTGRGFTGFIGYAPRTPTDAEVDTISRSETSTTGTATVTLPGSGQGAVADQVGAPMVACIFGGGWNGGGTFAMVPDPAWSELYNSDQFSLYAKTADAADVANTASYTWTYTNTGGSTGLVVTHASWPKRYGTTIGNPSDQITEGTDASVTSPGGRWQLAVIGQRTSSNTPKSEPDQMFVTSTAELIHDAGGNARGGNMKVYISDNVSPVHATFEDLGSFNVCGLMVVPVS